MVTVPQEELEFHFVASGGPGGQHANKAATKAELRWEVASSEAISAAVRERFVERYQSRISKEGVLILQCSSHRSRQQNVDGCIAKLQRMLNGVAEPPRTRRATRPTKGSVERRLEEKKIQAHKKRLRRSPKVPPE